METSSLRVTKHSTSWTSDTAAGTYPVLQGATTQGSIVWTFLGRMSPEKLFSVIIPHRYLGLKSIIWCNLYNNLVGMLFSLFYRWGLRLSDVKYPVQVCVTGTFERWDAMLIAVDRAQNPVPTRNVHMNLVNAYKEMCLGIVPYSINFIFMLASHPLKLYISELQEKG